MTSDADPPDTRVEDVLETTARRERARTKMTPMENSADTRTEKDQATDPGTVGPGPKSVGDQADSTERVVVEVRLTPSSLLLSSVLGASTLAVILIGGVLLLPTASASPGGIASLLLSVGLEMLLAFVALLSVLFLVGCWRHGRLVPTEARAWEDVLAVRVPAAWGTLIREELRIEDPRLEEIHRKASRLKEPPKTMPGEPSSSAKPASGGLLAKGSAQEWWDPGIYEVRAGTKAAEILKPRLMGNDEGKPAW